MTPYLKDLHQTIDSWRPYTREYGWHMSKKEIDLVRKDGNCLAEKYETEEVPLTVLSAKKVEGKC